MRSLETFFNFALISFFYDLITNKARKLKAAESYLIMEKNPSAGSLSLSISLNISLFFFCRLGFLSFSFLLAFYLSHTDVIIYYPHYRWSGYRFSYTFLRNGLETFIYDVKGAS